MRNNHNNTINTNDFDPNSIFNFEVDESNCNCRRRNRGCNQNASRPLITNTDILTTETLITSNQTAMLETSTLEMTMNQSSNLMIENRPSQNGRSNCCQAYQQGYQAGVKQGYNRGFRAGYCQAMTNRCNQSSSNRCCSQNTSLTTTTSTTNESANPSDNFFLF